MADDYRKFGVANILGSSVHLTNKFDQEFYQTPPACQTL